LERKKKVGSARVWREKLALQEDTSFFTWRSDTPGFSLASTKAQAFAGSPTH